MHIDIQSEKHGLTVSTNRISAIKEIFIYEERRYFLQQEDGSYKCIYEKLTDDTISQHIKKELTLGILPSSDSTTNWICFDVDSKDFTIITSIVGTLNHHQVRADIEDSGSKGYHLWVFINGHTDNIIVKKFANFIIDECGLSEEEKRCIEIFPKQDVITRVGCPIKLPWGIHRKTGKETHFIDHILKPIAFHDWYQHLERVEPHLIEEILEMNGIGLDVPALPISQLKTPKEIKPCVMKYLAEGVTEGERNTIAFIIAKEFHRVGKSRKDTIDALVEWNKKNKKVKESYTNQEIVNTVHSAFGGYANRSYGCKNEYLKRNCIGQIKCAYYHEFKKMNPSKRGGFNKIMFYKLGWQKVLNGSEAHAYTSVIPILEEEKIRGVGDWVFTNYAELSRYLGTSKPYTTKVLKSLKGHKLIEWIPGKRGKNHSPTKIRRIVPIPNPPVS